jgi:Flp pilus assembly protein TadG
VGEVKVFSHHRNRDSERGQITILLAVSLTVLLLFMALAIDVGFAYVTKAKLSKAVDAACLTAMRNLAQGHTKAGNLAVTSFNANYQQSTLDANTPIVTVGFTTDAYGQTLVNVTATATIRTFFMRILPQFQTFSVSDSAQATRGKLVMTLVLDRSGSMSTNGGSSALPPAVTSFVNYFDNDNDEVAMVSFSSNATVDVPIGYHFITPITNGAKALSFGGGTFGLGGLIDAKAQNESVIVQPGQNVVKVAVYFTDGHMNIIQDTFNCPAAKVINYGGYDSGSSFHFFDPSTAADWGTVNSKGYPPYNSKPDYCTGVTTFTSAIDGSHKTFSRTNITADAQYRAIQTANAMRAEGMVVYSIGLGNNVDQSFLQQIANDPASPSYNSSQPEGLAVFAPSCPSTRCSAQLLQVFQTIAAKILLRLTQ